MPKIRTHYDNLKITRNAPVSVIKAAYKALCQTYHPDKFQGSNSEAERIMKIVNASYVVLTNPVKRALHDVWIDKQEAKQQNEKVRSAAASKATEQHHQKQEKQNNPKNEEPSTPTSKNSNPYDVAARKRWRDEKDVCLPTEGWAILVSKIMDNTPLLILFLIVSIAIYKENVIPHQEQRQQAQSEQITPELETFYVKPKEVLTKYGHKPTQVRPSQVTKSKDKLINSAKIEVPPDYKLTQTPPAIENKPVYTTKPSVAPNGQSWPTYANYIEGYEQLNASGLSSVTVDNSQNDSDVFVKLVFLDNGQTYPVRQFYIPAFSSFTLNKVATGNYDIRYRDLSNGGLSRSEAFNLVETPTYNGTQYSTITMTLYKVQNGNMHTYGLSEVEF